MDLSKQIARVKAILGTPRTEWPVIASEPATIGGIYKDYVLMLAAIPAVFGFLITLMGCYHGYTSRGGAQGVGMATTSAVVSASILILTFNYFITEAFFAR